MKALAFAAVTAVVTGLVTPEAKAQQKSIPPDTLHYDIYQPSQRLRTRRDNCFNDEDMKGAYCVKKCARNYVAFGNGHPPRCRSVDPLPPGVMPSAERVQTGVQPPRNKSPGQQHPDKQ
jgi:hypothetical protein